MILIGNQIRLMRSLLSAASEQRRSSLFKTLARQQVDAGATWLLVDMGPQRKNAAGDLTWLVNTIHAEVRVPLVLRSDDLAALEAGLQVAKDRVLIDATLPAVTGHSDLDPAEALEPYLALARQYGAYLAFAACPGGMPLPTEERLTLVTESLLPKALGAGLGLESIYVDPMVAALTCDQPQVPATVETLHLLKVAAEPSPNTLIHLDDISDGVADAAKPYITQAYAAMLLAAGVDAISANPLDPDLMETIRVILARDPATAYDRLLVRLFDVTKAGVDLDIAAIDPSDRTQVNLFKTVQVLTNRLIYADSYLNV
jgi:5-methyltetrahydrofolate--homocysteine methyltransferase